MTIRTEQRSDGKMYAIAGSSRQGKSHWLKKKIKNALRLVVWDIRGEYLEENVKMCRNLSELAQTLKEAGKKKARIAYWGKISDFDGFCELAYVWGQLWPATIVAEEISDVTNPGKAPDAWGELIRKGLFYGNFIYAVTQRVQECDKTVWGNATVKHIHTLVNSADREYMSSRMNCTPEQLNMKPYHYCEIEAGKQNATFHKPI